MRRFFMSVICVMVLVFALSVPVEAAWVEGWIWVQDMDYTFAQPAAPGAEVGINSSGTIEQDWGIFTDIFISRDNGRTWFPVVENDSKQFQWGTPTTLASVNIPVGTYTLSKNRQSSEWLICNFQIDHNNDGNTGDLVAVANKQVDLEGDQGQFCVDPIDLTVTRNGSSRLSLNCPIVGAWVKVRFDDANVAGTLTVLEVDNDLDIEDAGLGNKFEVS